jgi:endoglucanase
MDQDFKNAVGAALTAFKPKMLAMLSENPYGVPISRGGWGGAGSLTRLATEMYLLHRAFPEVIGPEYTLNGLDYVLGRHPASNVSYVSGVGTRSKLIAYGNNRADYTFIPGGMIPGIVIIQPDFPELKEGWPFLWYENEYVVDAVTSFIVAANAAHTETKNDQR